MTVRIAINGFGRIGRNILRAYYEHKLYPQVKIVAINDLGEIQTNAHLLRYDSTHGKFPFDVVVKDRTILIQNDEIKVLSERNPAHLPWKQMKIDVVLECTGSFTDREKAFSHIIAGAKKVIISAPGTAVDATIVYGVNHSLLSKGEHTIISNASCTTNCLATVIKPLHETFGIVNGVMNTIHAYTNDQHLLDLYHRDLRRARSAVQSIIPAKTGAATAVGLVLPELQGKLSGFALRVPTMNVSVVDFTFTVAKEIFSRSEINQVMQQAASHSLKNILVINDQPLVSIDFNHHPASAIFEPENTIVMGNLVKILAWYDNEWGFSNRMLDVTAVWMKVC